MLRRLENCGDEDRYRATYPQQHTDRAEPVEGTSGAKAEKPPNTPTGSRLRQSSVGHGSADTANAAAIAWPYHAYWPEPMP
mmetsp:Transcript_45039/g.124813  ORF Transcript_45039/g.124813 Transcript_45039/m.124813 type:complete len:81 (-) Transcript_45039:2-244(-)